MEIESADDAGEVVRTLKGTRDTGVNRVWWDLMGEPVEEVRLRTKPLFSDDMSLGNERWRPVPGGPLEGPGLGTILQPPGN